MTKNKQTKRLTFQWHQRLHGKAEFAKAYHAKLRKSVKLFSLCAAPNELAYGRMGLSVSRRVGNAAQRHRIKRLLREAFRTTQHDWPNSYDMIVIVRPHQAVSLADYQRLLLKAIKAIDMQYHRQQQDVIPNHLQNNSRHTSKKNDKQNQLSS